MAYSAILGGIAVWLAVLYVLTADASKKRHRGGIKKEHADEEQEIIKALSEMNEGYGGSFLGSFSETYTDFADCVAKLGKHNPNNVLPAEDICLIKQSWEPVMLDSKKHGTIILKAFLDKHNYYNKFSKFKNVPYERIETTPVFQNHADNIMLNVNKDISLLQDGEELTRHLNLLGKIHKYRGITINEFKDLRNVILRILSNTFRISGAQYSAWEALFAAALPLVEKGMASV